MLQCFAAHCFDLDRETGDNSLAAKMKAKAARTALKCGAACSTEPPMPEEEYGEEGADFKVRVQRVGSWFSGLEGCKHLILMLIPIVLVVVAVLSPSLVWIPGGFA